MLKNLNNFEFLDKKQIIGEGGFSRVFRARNKIDQKIYALKKVDISWIGPSDRENLKREIKIHQSLDHFHVIKFHDAF